MSRRLNMTLGAIFGFLSVALGAFGAHALKGRISPEALATFETGVRYQSFHAVALLALAALSSAESPGADRRLSAAGMAFATGIVLFSFSLYALALTGIRSLGIITPFGGLAFLSGWALIFLSTRRS